MQLGEVDEDGLIFTSSDAQYCTGAGGLSENISDNGVSVSVEENNISEATSVVLSKISEQTQENISAPSPSPPLRYKKALKEENMKSRQEIIDKSGVKSQNKPKECSVTTPSPPTDICDVFDPYDIVEHIADLTVEQLKESLLGGQEPNKIVEDVTETNNNAIAITPRKPTKKIRNDVKKIQIEEETKSVTPPSRTKKKENNPDKLVNKGREENMLTVKNISQVESSSSSQDNSLASSRSETPTKKRCRLRIVKKEEQMNIDDKAEERFKGKTKPNEDATVKMEEGKLNCKIEPESNQSKLRVTETKISNGKSTINDEKTVHKVDSKLSTKDKCLMNNLNEKKNAAVNIPITPIKKLEVLPKNDPNNGQLCRQTQGKIEKSKIFLLF